MLTPRVLLTSYFLLLTSSFYTLTLLLTPSLRRFILLIYSLGFSNRSKDSYRFGTSYFRTSDSSLLVLLTSVLLTS